jgi:hypothetical protein
VQNKANFEHPDPDPRAQLGKTKPNMGRMGHLEDGASGRPILRNKTNSPPDRREADSAKRTQFLQKPHVSGEQRREVRKATQMMDQEWKTINPNSPKGI